MYRPELATRSARSTWAVGLATGDLDNDGRIDTVVQSQNEPLVYLHNQTVDSGNWLTLRLEGDAPIATALVRR